MKESLSEKLAKGRVVTMAWSSLGAPLIAEILVRCGYESVNVDMQHGLYGFAEARDAIAGIGLAGGHAIARIPISDYATASRFLDCGAEAVIAPMINSVEDAKQFVKATKFPPLGCRSYGPQRAVSLAKGQEYVDRANSSTMALAMIETKEALDSVEAIANVEGIDGLFVGPADLSISLSNGHDYNPTGERVMRASAEIARHAKKAGKTASAFAVSLEHASEFEKLGFTLISNATDMGIMKAGSDLMLQTN